MAQKASILPLVALIVVVLIVAGGVSAYVYTVDKPKPPSRPFLVQVGDNVTVNYVGIFGSGPDQGKVFDTSIYADAINDASFPKALQYHPRGAAANYTPLPVHVGGNTPQSGYSLHNMSFIQVVTGFWKGLVGLRGNESHLLVVPPSLGYGYGNPACLRTMPLTVTFPVYQSLSGLAFTALYPGVLATTGASFTNPTYGFTVEILSANSTSVALENIAYSGETTDLQGWPAEVASVVPTSNGTGLITIQNLINGAQAGHLAGTTTHGLCANGGSAAAFIVTEVNTTAGTFTENFNQEVSGQTLLFEVAVVNIYVPTNVVA